MRTTIELPDDLLARAKSMASLNRLSLKQFFIEAIELKLTPAEPHKVRRPPPVISTGGPPIPDLTAEQLADAFFGTDDESLSRR